MDEKREPLLSDYDSILDCDDTDSDGWHTYYERSAMDKLWRFYESKITSGELRVVKEVDLAWKHPDGYGAVEIYGVPDKCTGCQTEFFLWADAITKPSYCPGCGSRIKTQD